MDNVVREEIVEWISKPENKDLLETLKLMKEAANSGDWFDELTEEQVKSVERGKKDHNQGNILTSKEFWKKSLLKEK